MKKNKSTYLLSFIILIIMFALNPSEKEHCKQMGCTFPYNEYTNLLIASFNTNDNLLRHRKVVSFGVLNKVFEVSVKMY